MSGDARSGGWVVSGNQGGCEPGGGIGGDAGVEGEAIGTGGVGLTGGLDPAAEFGGGHFAVPARHQAIEAERNGGQGGRYVAQVAGGRASGTMVSWGT